MSSRTTGGPWITSWKQRRLAFLHVLGREWAKDGSFYKCNYQIGWVIW